MATLRTVRVIHGTDQNPCITNWYWLTSRSEWLQICLISFYINQESESGPESNNKPIQLNSCLVLVALLAIRYQKNELFINEVPLYPTTANILQKLTVSLMKLESMMNLEQAFHWADAILWMLFVAALAEQRLQGSNVQSTQSSYWTQKLTHLLDDRELSAWGDVCELLEQFPYTERELPLPMTG